MADLRAQIHQMVHNRFYLMAMRAQDEVLKHNVYEFCHQCCIVPDVCGAGV